MKLYNPFKPHIVKFKDGKYALRVFSIFYLDFVYKSLDTGHWFSSESLSFINCKADSVSKLCWRSADRGEVID